MKSLRKMWSSFKNVDTMVLIYTGCMFWNHMSYGFTTNVSPGSTLVDLGYVYNASVKAMSYLASLVAGGYMLGSLAGFSYRWINRQLMLSISASFMAICFTLTPFCPSLWLCYLMTFLYGLGSGIWDSSISLWLVELWTIKSSAFLHGSQFSFGVGMAVGPVLASGFLHGEEKNETLADGTHVYYHVSVEDRKQSLIAPFLIGGIIQLIVPVILLLLYFIRPYKNYEDQETLEDNDNKQQDNNRRRSSVSLTATSSRRVSLVKIPNTEKQTQPEEKIPYRVFKIILVGFSIGAYGSAENNFWSFYSSALQYLPVNRSASEAALIISLVCIFYTIGRLASAFISLHLSPDIILIYHFLTTIVSVITLYFACTHNIVWLVYIGSGLFGLGISAIWPGLFSWTEHYLKLNNTICSLFSFLSGVLTLITPFFIGDHLKETPIMLFYFSGAGFILSLAAFLLVKLFVHLTPAQQIDHISSTQHSDQKT